MSEFLKSDSGKDFIDPETDEFFTESEFLEVKDLDKDDLDFSIEESIGEKVKSVTRNKTLDELHAELNEVTAHINKMNHLSKAPDEVFYERVKDENNFYKKLHYFERKRAEILKKIKDLQ